MLFVRTWIAGNGPLELVGGAIAPPVAAEEVRINVRSMDWIFGSKKFSKIKIEDQKKSFTTVSKHAIA